LSKIVSKIFFLNLNFCLCLQNYTESFLSILIAVTPQHLSENRQNSKKSRDGFTIELLTANENKIEFEQIISDFVKNLFQSINSKIFNNNKGLSL